ncbi:TetR family transcriptional regulator [Streptomyces sp. NPDC014889]|uniref:TetR family transcriptional regulator n=1 Tax=Streptomyces sp. NPDC014889 TaxID=3364928 RepID=UPI0036FA541C
MHPRAEQTRYELIRAAATRIRCTGLRSAGLIAISRDAGVSRGALNFHFPTKGALAASVYSEARAVVTAMLDAAFSDASAEPPARFGDGLWRAAREDPVVGAGLRLTADGTEEPAPRLREEVLEALHEHTAEQLRGRPDATAVADLVVVIAAGLESLSRVKVRWWNSDSSSDVWDLVRPLLATAE